MQQLLANVTPRVQAEATTCGSFPDDARRADRSLRRRLAGTRRVKVTRAVCTAYVVACVAVMLLVAAGALAGFELARGWATALADVLGMPWSLLAAQMSDPGAVGRMVLGAAAMTLNLAIIFQVGRWLAARRA
jgi:hypothetical protein